MKSACIIPTKNRKACVSQAIESVLSQKLKVDEIVVVDDGSTDGTPAFLRKRYPFVKIVMAKGAGPGKARNLGAGAASAEILFFLDSDDTWHQEHTLRLSSAFARGFHVAYGRTETRDVITGSTFFIPEPGYEIEGKCLNELLRWCHLVPSSLAVTRLAFEQVGGFPGCLVGEDWLFFLRLAMHYEFYFCSSVTTFRRLHEESLSCSRAWKGSELLDLVRKVEELALSSHMVDETTVNIVASMRKLVKENCACWRTIQDWYVAARQRGLV